MVHILCVMDKNAKSSRNHAAKTVTDAALRAVQVQGLAGERALHVACGVWHTAAVAAHSLSVRSAQHSRSGSGGSGLDPAEWDAIQQKMADAYSMLDEVSCCG